MYSKNVEAFYNDLCHSDFFSDDLQQKLRNIHDENQYKKFLEDEILPIAKSKGYNISVDDILAYENLKLKKLDIEKLESITGGKIEPNQFSKFIPIFITCAAAMTLSRGIASAVKPTPPTLTPSHNNPSTPPKKDDDDDSTPSDKKHRMGNKGISLAEFMRQPQRKEPESPEEKKLAEKGKKYSELQAINAAIEKKRAAIVDREKEIAKKETDKTKKMELRRQNSEDWKYIDEHSSSVKLLSEIEESYKIQQAAYAADNAHLQTVKYFLEKGIPNRVPFKTEKWKYDPSTKALEVKNTSFDIDDYKSLLSLDIEHIVFNDKMVTNIPDNFCAFRFHRLKTVMGSNILEIGAHAFDSSCVEEVKFPRANIIGKQAFYDCEKLKSIRIPMYAQYDSTTFKNIPYEAMFYLYDKGGVRLSPDSKDMHVTSKTLIPIDETILPEEEKLSEKIKDVDRGEYLFNQGQIEEALPLIISSYKSGSTRAAVLLGDCFYKGYGSLISQNPHAAISLYRQAAIFDDTEAMIRLGDFYRYNNNKEQAIFCYTKAWNEHDDINAFAILQNYYSDLVSKEHPLSKFRAQLKPEQIVQSPDRSFQYALQHTELSYYKSAAYKGHVQAMNRLGGIYYDESFKHTDMKSKIEQLEEARKWWQYAANRGDSEARSNVYRVIQEEIYLLKDTKDPEFKVLLAKLQRISTEMESHLSTTATDTFEDLTLSVMSILNQTLPPIPRHGSSSLTIEQDLKTHDVAEQDLEAHDVAEQDLEAHDVARVLSDSEAKGFLEVSSDIPVITVKKGMPIQRPSDIKRGEIQLIDFSGMDDEFTFSKKSIPKVPMTLIKGNLFKHYPYPIDIIQNGVGDCYFLSSLMSIVNTDPYTIMNAILDNGDGTVTIRFYDIENESTPIYYRVAKTMPDNIILHDPNAAPWVSLFEKAYNLHRYYTETTKNLPTTPLDYTNIEGGDPEISTCDITGNQDSFHEDLTLLSNPKLIFEKINQRLENYHIVINFSKAPDQEKEGLLYKHAYTILGTKTVKDKTGKEINLVIIRNPHGCNIPKFIRQEDGKVTIEWLNNERAIHRNGIFTMSIDQLIELETCMEYNLKRPTRKIQKLI